MKHVRSMCLLTALSLCLTGCATKAVRPSKEPEPPKVDCEQGKTPDGPEWPGDWLRDGPAFAIAWLGIAAEERKLRAIEHECIRKHREEGLIR
jgi:hypothetical protein